MFFPSFSVLLAALVAATTEQSPSNDGLEYTYSAVDPREYHQFRKIAKCKAQNRLEGTVEEIDIAYIEMIPPNKKPKGTLLFVHGWPGMWINWLPQIEYFKDDYHLIIPDQRGTALSTHPDGGSMSGRINDVVDDYTCVLQHAGVDRAVCIGHDWGSPVCHEAGRARPDIYDGIVGVTVPYIPCDQPFFSPDLLAERNPYFGYQVYFNRQWENAWKTFNKDIRRSIRSMFTVLNQTLPSEFLRSQVDFLGSWKDYKEIPATPLLPPVVEDYYVEQMSIQGYKWTLDFYLTPNREDSHAIGYAQGNATLSQPVFFISPSADPFADWLEAAEMMDSFSYLKNYDVDTSIKAAHWPHLERPEEFNEILGSWLERKMFPASHDEL